MRIFLLEFSEIELDGFGVRLKRGYDARQWSIDPESLLVPGSAGTEEVLNREQHKYYKQSG